MNHAGFKALARRLCVGHAFSTPVRWGVEVEVFGRQVQPGQLIHADKHGFLAIPFSEERGLLEAATFMDVNECHTMIAAARGSGGLSTREILTRMDQAQRAFATATLKRFGNRREC